MDLILFDCVLGLVFITPIIKYFAVMRYIYSNSRYFVYLTWLGNTTALGSCMPF